MNTSQINAFAMTKSAGYWRAAWNLLKSPLFRAPGWVGGQVSKWPSFGKTWQTGAKWSDRMTAKADAARAIADTFAKGSKGLPRWAIHAQDNTGKFLGGAGGMGALYTAPAIYEGMQTNKHRQQAFQEISQRLQNEGVMSRLKYLFNSDHFSK